MQAEGLRLFSGELIARGLDPTVTACRRDQSEMDGGGQVSALSCERFTKWPGCALTERRWFLPYLNTRSISNRLQGWFHVSQSWMLPWYAGLEGIPLTECQPYISPHPGTLAWATSRNLERTRLMKLFRSPCCQMRQLGWEAVCLKVTPWLIPEPLALTLGWLCVRDALLAFSEIGYFFFNQVILPKRIPPLKLWSSLEACSCTRFTMVTAAL